MKAVALALTMFWATALAGAQAQAGFAQSLPVSVIEIDSGDVLTNLSPAQFQVKLDGVPATIVSAERDFGQRSLVLVLDLNGGVWERRKRTVDDILSRAGTKHRIAVVAFAKNGLRQFGFDAGMGAIRQWLATVDAGKAEFEEMPRPVGLFDAIHAAAGMFPAREFAAAVLVFGSGWNDYPSHTGWKNLQSEL